MLAIRMQRTGRSGHAHFRVVVQDSRKSPKSGKFVALLGSYDPHTKATTLDKDQTTTFINNGAQPSPRVAALLKSEGVKLPKWVDTGTKKKGKIRNPEKLRANRPAGAEAPAEKPVVEPKAEVGEEATTQEPVADATPKESATEEVIEAKTEDSPVTDTENSAEHQSDIEAPVEQEQVAEAEKEDKKA